MATTFPVFHTLMQDSCQVLLAGALHDHEVLHEEAVVRLHLRSRHPALFSSDGRETIALHQHDWVEVRRATQTLLFARVHPPSAFYTNLAQRLRREG
jgi:NAD kinase